MNIYLFENGILNHVDLYDYYKKSEVSQLISNAVSNIDASNIRGIINLDQIPAAAQERLVNVEDKESMLALTIEDIQNGDSVKLLDTGNLYHVIDDTKLGTMDAFTPFTSGIAGSVEWTSVLNKPELYDKNEINSILESKLETKANVGDAYTKSESNYQLQLKMGKDDAYTKTEVDTKLAGITAAVPSVSGLALYSGTIAVGKTLKVTYSSPYTDFFLIIRSGTSAMVIYYLFPTATTLKFSNIVDLSGSTKWCVSNSQTSNTYSWVNWQVATYYTIIPLHNITGVSVV